LSRSTGRLADPEFRRERASKAGRARTSVDYHIQKLIESAPTPTPEQAERLRAWLPPVAEDGGGADGEAA
jgi:hypothetical protein